MAKEKKLRIYSNLSGFNIYYVIMQHYGARVPDNFVITDIRENNETNLHASVVYRSSEPMPETKAAWFAEIIQNPVSNSLFQWPIDLIEIKRATEYVVCLVYRNAQYSHMKPIKELLYQPGMSKILDWRNPFIITVCKYFLTAMSVLHSNGYIYNDFDIRNILYNPDSGEVFFKFTPNLRKARSNSQYDKVDCAAISPEFAPPFVYNEEMYNGFMTKKTDYYQITALLFRLMIGRLPYEGRDLMNYGIVFDPQFDTDDNAHKYYFQHYHQYPHFIFDENDVSNSLSTTTDNDMPRERWELLPDNVKNKFNEILCGNAAESGTYKNITPDAWLKAVSSLETESK